ncbi:MAG: 5-deoxy-glucuronate isomerase [Caldiserica bacterium]|nr:5-deoxy-glucuronate isomerase [Caldisericota bacterium]
MATTIKKYAREIKSGKAKLFFPYQEGGKGTILDPSSPEIPLDILEFGIYDLKEGPFTRETGDREVVLVPQEGHFRIEVGGKRWEGDRKGGPFAPPYGENNASAIYVGSDSRFTLTGEGEVIFYSAPAFKDLPACFIPQGSKKYVSRGEAFWRRDVVTLVTPGNETSNLAVGETYSPPGLWSGTPLHIHDLDDPSGKQSDHEEVYYHISRFKGEEIGSYPVQLVFDKDLDIWFSFIVRDKSIIALPGGCHPVVASPVSDIIYGWGMANHGKAPILYDLPEFAYLKKVENLLGQIKEKVRLSEIESLPEYKLLPEIGKKVLELILREERLLREDEISS